MGLHLHKKQLYAEKLSDRHIFVVKLLINSGV